MARRGAHRAAAKSASDEVIAFRLGERAAFEPPPDAGESGQTTTTRVSWWNHLICATCGHTFRRGDRVRIDQASSAVVHLDPALGCATANQHDEAVRQVAASGSPELDDFAEGLVASWPSAGGTPVTRLGHGDWRTTKPRPPLERARCLFCAHTFRENEHVVVCPCSPANPACGAAVHRDPIAGLVCWESWQPTGRVRLCPLTSSRPVQQADQP